MSKDPAILFYFNDWQGGTMTLNRRQKGCYMDLLCAQFNTGHLSLDAIKTVLGNDFAEWGVLQKKFKSDDDGLFFNERLLFEKTRRKDFSEKQSKKRLGKTKQEPNLNQNETYIENENRNEDEIIKNKMEEIFSSTIWLEGVSMTIGLNFLQTSNYLTEFLNKENAKESLYRPISDIKAHFVNWIVIQKEKIKTNGTTETKQSIALKNF